ncbi:MAG: outer membrane lipoprotein carrier protein LolA [Myxococcota bacterium]
MRSSPAFRPERGPWAACLAAVLAVAAAVPAAAQDDGVDLDALLSAFARMPGLEAAFVEEKHMALLAKPLVSRGRLYFTSPGLLLRRVRSPRPSEVVVTPRAVRFRDGDGEQTIDLRSRSEVRPLVETMVWLLEGDREALESAYRMAFRERGEGWTLALTPRSAPLSKLVARIRVRGEGYAVREIRVEETSGDATVTRITDVNPRRTFTDREKRKLFGTATP